MGGSVINEGFHLYYSKPSLAPQYNRGVPRFTILNPCPKQWDELDAAGADARERHCTTCDTPIYDYAEYSKQEWAAIWNARDGHVCGKLPATHSRRIVLALGAASLATCLAGETGTVKLVVLDSAGAVVPSPHADLFGKPGKPPRTQVGNAQGEIIWTELPPGKHTVQIRVDGFKLAKVTVEVADRRETAVEVRLALQGSTMMGIFTR